MNIEQLRDEVINDALDTCIEDHGYLKSILQSYFANESDERIIQLHNEAFAYGDRYHEL
jgi:uncharacterized membrane protein YheB (UPF0754 family)